GDRAVGADGVLDHDLAGLARAQRITREGRRGHRQRTQVGGGRGGSGRGTGGGGPLFGGTLLGLLLGDAVGLGLGFGGFLVGGLLLGQFARGLFLLALLVGQALALDLDLARGLLLGTGGLGGDARDGGLLACLDVGLQAVQRRMGRLGLLDQCGEPAGLVEVLASDALLGRDDGHRQQVGQCTGCTGVIRRLVTQREVVLDRVVLDRGVQAILAVGLARGLAQFVHAEREAARKAYGENRLYAPVENNAVEYYLALRDKAPDDAGASSALTDLLPMTVIATEQSITREDFNEARRLAALVEKAQPTHPALDRLKTNIEAREKAAVARVAAEATSAEEQAARQVEIERQRLADQKRQQEQAARELAQKEAADKETA